MADWFEDRARAELAKGGIRLELDGRLSLDPSFEGTPRATQEQLDAHNEQQRNRVPLGGVLREWARNLHYVCVRLTKKESNDAWALHAAFYLRLHGFFVDFAKLYPLPFTGFSTLEAVREAIAELRNQLTEDEQLWAEYRRHADGHIWQTGYEPRAWKKGSKRPKNLFESKFTGKSYSFADVRERLDKVIRRYNGNEHAIADDFAKRLMPHAARLELAMTAFTSSGTVQNRA